MKTIALAILMVVSLGPDARSATDPQRAIRINPGVIRAIPTDRVVPTVTTTVTNNILKVRVPTNATVLVRERASFKPLLAGRIEGTNRVYELQSSDVYVVQPQVASTQPVALSTNSVCLPNLVRAVIDGQQIEGCIEVALQSQLMEYDAKSREYQGLLVLCFRSNAKAELAQKLLPLPVRLLNSSGLRLATNVLSITRSGVSGCHDIPIFCRADRSEGTITVKSDVMGDQPFTINFERPSFWVRFETAIIVVGGIVLGCLGGLIRSWRLPSRVRFWKIVAEGGFCGLIIVLLGEIAAQKLFQIEGAITTSIIWGMSGVGGYLGPGIFERFVLKPPGDKPEERAAL